MLQVFHYRNECEEHLNRLFYIVYSLLKHYMVKTENVWGIQVPCEISG